MDGKATRGWIAGLTGLLLAQPIQAETYHVLNRTASGMLALDIGSAKRIGEFARIYTTLFYYADGGDGQSQLDPHTAFVKTRDEYDCNKPRFRHIVEFDYDAEGKPVGRREGPSPWREISPDSIPATKRALACGLTEAPADKTDLSPIEMLHRVRADKPPD